MLRLFFSRDRQKLSSKRSFFILMKILRFLLGGFFSLFFLYFAYQGLFLNAAHTIEGAGPSGEQARQLLMNMARQFIGAFAALSLCAALGWFFVKRPCIAIPCALVGCLFGALALYEATKVASGYTLEQKVATAEQAASLQISFIWVLFHVANFFGILIVLMRRSKQVILPNPS